MLHILLLERQCTREMIWPKATLDWFPLARTYIIIIISVWSRSRQSCPKISWACAMANTIKISKYLHEYHRQKKRRTNEVHIAHYSLCTRSFTYGNRSIGAWESMTIPSSFVVKVANYGKNISEIKTYQHDNSTSSPPTWKYFSGKRSCTSWNSSRMSL